MSISEVGDSFFVISKMQSIGFNLIGMLMEWSIISFGRSLIKIEMFLIITNIEKIHNSLDLNIILSSHQVTPINLLEYYCLILFFILYSIRISFNFDPSSSSLFYLHHFYLFLSYSSFCIYIV